MKKKIVVDFWCFINLIILFALIMATFFIKDCKWDTEIWTLFICVCSGMTLLFQIVSLSHYGTGIINVLTFFFVLNHIFNFGYYYVHLFNKDEFLILFTNWFSQNFDTKIEAALFSICAIQAMFCGVLIYVYQHKNCSTFDYKISAGLGNQLREKIIFYVGLVMLIISMPCKLYWDIQQIILSSINSEYAGGFSASGLIDDIQVLFIPSLICLISGKKRNKKRFGKVIMLLYLIYSVTVMTMSGARRAYVTGILALFIFYYSFFNEGKKKHRIIKNVLLIVVAIVCLNFLTLIRDSRHSALGINAIFSGNLSEFLSVDFLWETLAEFGSTGSVIYFSVYFVPQFLNYMYGSMYLSSFIYIFPIGWLIKLNNASGGVVINQLAQSRRMTISSVGGSVLGDLFVNWGWFSIIAAVVLGYLIGKIGYISKQDSKDINLRNVMVYSVGIVILNYSRSSTSEILRPIAFIMVGIYFLFFLILQRCKTNKNYLNGGRD